MARGLQAHGLLPKMRGQRSNNETKTVMIPYKPFEKKPMVHSPRGETIMANVAGYMIRAIRDGGQMDVRLQCPGQCIAALRAAKANNSRVMVYAIGRAFGEDCMELVDEDFLQVKWNEQQNS